jgi:hypothetical protein
MILTEDEAKTKACCKIMPHKENGTLMTVACLASGCMAWRWIPGMFCFDKGRFLAPGESAQEGHYEMRPTDKGYCGLAGWPE